MWMMSLYLLQCTLVKYECFSRIKINDSSSRFSGRCPKFGWFIENSCRLVGWLLLVLHVWKLLGTKTLRNKRKDVVQVSKTNFKQLSTTSFWHSCITSVFHANVFWVFCIWFISKNLILTWNCAWAFIFFYTVWQMMELYVSQIDKLLHLNYQKEVFRSWLLWSWLIFFSWW